jgi:DNA-binding transcriptional LysR family regulator
MAVKGPLIVNQPGLCISAAVAGVGLTYTVANTIEPLISDGRLQPCLESFMPSIPGFFLYFPSTAQVLPKLRAFLDYWRRERS